jgi:Leucine-rich repeat (LRR) protein
LRYFHVGDNNLTGPIPPISGMQNLAGFGVSNNQLSGSIPPLEDLPQLFDFEVSNNQLTGNIPPLIGVPSLWEFLANDNLLTGTIPRIGSMQMLETFNVANNLLEGPPPPVVPSGLRPINSVNGDITALCPNNLDHVESAAWDAATGVTPWYRDCTGSVDVIYSDGFDGTP